MAFIHGSVNWKVGNSRAAITFLPRILDEFWREKCVQIALDNGNQPV
jgi:hypothetical protein